MAVIGRPTIVTETVLQKLEEAFLCGCTDLEACLLADISKSTLYNYQNENPDFLERKQVLKQNPFMKSRQVLMQALNENDVATAHKILERKEGKTVNIQGGDNPLSVSVSAKWSVQPVKVADSAG